MKSGIIYTTRFDEGLRVFKPDYYLNSGKKTISDLIDRGVKYELLANLSDKLYQGGIFKRVFVKSGEKAYKYVTATDVQKISPLDTAKNISKKYTPWIEEMTLRSNQILVSCAGTGSCGRTALVNKSYAGNIGSQEIIRVETSSIPYGYLYAFLSTDLIYEYIQSMTYGAAIPRISPEELGKLPILLPEDSVQDEIHDHIVTGSKLREGAAELLEDSKRRLKQFANLPDLSQDDYEYFGNHDADRKKSTFKKSINEINSLTINAFNYSKRVEYLESKVQAGSYLNLNDCLDQNQFFSTGSFKRLELDSPKSIKLINQSDIFNVRKQGKNLARIFVKSDRLVEYGEILITGVGTLGESEAFCRTIFANEELEGQLISGEFIRMKTNSKVPSGYLYAWLSSDYGFRFIRKTQSGTKLCRPIQELLKKIPVPIIEKEEMLKIDEQVKKAHTMLFEALNAENKAIELVENEIESWQKS